MNQFHLKERAIDGDFIPTQIEKHKCDHKNDTKHYANFMHLLKQISYLGSPFF